jgi:hypothetical protein
MLTILKNEVKQQIRDCVFIVRNPGMNSWKRQATSDIGGKPEGQNRGRERIKTLCNCLDD